MSFVTQMDADRSDEFAVVRTAETMAATLLPLLSAAQAEELAARLEEAET